jgi:cytochrome-b5 reductase
MSTQIALAAAAVGVGAAFVYLRSGPPTGKPLFSKFGFHSLKLHSTELINNNTKKLRFELPDASQPSGLALTSALLTIGFPGGGWKPNPPRPYTPTNDLGKNCDTDHQLKITC